MTAPADRMDRLAAQLHDASLMAAQIAQTHEDGCDSEQEPTGGRGAMSALLPLGTTETSGGSNDEG